MNLFSLQHNWILLNYNRSNIDINLNLLLDSHVYGVLNNNDGSYLVQAIYKTHKHATQFQEKDVAVWSKKAGFSFYKQLIFTRDRNNLNGITLNISYVLIDFNSLNHLEDYRELHIDAMSKFNYLLTQCIAVTMNASTNFILQESWGYKNDTNGIFSGMVGDLQQGFADIAGTPLYFIKDRVAIMDYIAAPTKTYAKFLFRAPPLSYVTNIFTHPFDSYVWYASIVLTFIVSFIIYIIIKCEWNVAVIREKALKRPTVLRPKFTDVLLMEVGAICQQGAEAEPTSGAGRIATIFLFIAFMFIYTSYCANIVAILQSTTDSIKTIEDLINSRIKLGVEITPYSYHYFQAETEPTRKLLYETKIAPKGQVNTFMSLEEGMEKMRDEFFAFHVGCTSAYQVISKTFLEHEKCKLKEIDIWNSLEPYNAVQKNSSYKELVKIGFRRIHEYGIQSREYKLLYTKKPICHQSSFMSVGLIDCYYAFLLYIAGMLLAIIILASEVIHSKYKHK